MQTTDSGGSATENEGRHGVSRRRRIIMATLLTIATGGCDDGGDSGGGAPPPMPMPMRQPDPIRIIRGAPGPETWLDLTVEGRGFARYEGAMVTVRMGLPDRPPERLVAGQARIVEGAFSLTFADSNEGGLYKQRLVFIDTDGNAACTPEADAVYSDFRALIADQTLTLADSDPPAPAEARLPLAFDAASACRQLDAAWPRE